MTRNYQSLPVNFDNIPDQMKSKQQWVCWRAAWDPARGKYSKHPYQAKGQFAKSTDPATWSDYQSVKSAYSSGNFTGIGFVLNGFIGIDLDHAAVDGELKPWAAEIVSLFRDTYIEWSPSGDGIHILCTGAKTDPRCESKWLENGQDVGIEIYDRGRYFTVTGQSLTENLIVNCQSEIEAFQSRYFPKEYRPPLTPLVTTLGDSEIETMLSFIPADDRTIWIKVCSALKAGGFTIDIFDRWSQTSHKYASQADCEKLWNSIGEPRCNPASIKWLAKHYGYVVPSFDPTVTKLQRASK